MALQIVATDEGDYIARLAWRDSASSRLLVQHETKKMWEGGLDDVQHFAAVVSAALQDVVEWTVS